jgi:HAE1 family hydrophobic/amphiphilic exporter-1
MPTAFIPEEDQGYLFGVVQLPRASSLQQTTEASERIEQILLKTPGVQYVTSIIGFNLLSTVTSTYTGFFFITLEEWSKRKTPELQVDAIQANINKELAALANPTAAFAFPPPAIPGIGTAGGVTFILEDRTGGPVEFIASNTQKFMAALKARPELTTLFTTSLWDVPQIHLSVDEAQAMIQGVSLTDAYQTVQTFLGGYFVNYFNRFGLQWQVYVQAEGEYRNDLDNLGMFYISNNKKEAVPVNSFITPKESFGPEFTMRHNMFRCSQVNAAVTAGYSTAQAMRASLLASAIASLWRFMRASAWWSQAPKLSFSQSFLRIMMTRAACTKPCLAREAPRPLIACWYVAAYCWTSLALRK